MTAITRETGKEKGTRVIGFFWIVDGGSRLGTYLRFWLSMVQVTGVVQTLTDTLSRLTAPVCRVGSNPKLL